MRNLQSSCGLWENNTLGFIKGMMVGLNDAAEMLMFSNVLKTSVYIQLHQPAIIIAGCSAAFASVISIFLIFQHLHSYTNPAEQKWVVAVLFMVPVYATESIISLSAPKLSLACDILRNCYEAFALYSFGSYLVACLGGERNVLRLLDTESRETVDQALLEDEGAKQKTQQSSLRKFIMRPYFLGRDLLSIEKFGLVQYMILKTLCAFLALVLELLGVYGDGEFKWYYGYPYITVVLNFSQMWALYCLVQFYHVTYEQLQPISPLAKFISFKAIVFATWWQGVGIALLCAIGVFPKEGKFQTGLQDFLICIEMAIAAVAHIYVFSAKPYQYVTAEEYGRITTETTQTVVEVDENGENSPVVIEKSDTKIEAPGTSIKESVQDIVVGGGQHVVKDVVLTINQAMQPVEKGMKNIHEKIQHISESSGKIEEAKLEIEEHMEGDKLTRNKSFEFHEEIVT